MPHRYEEANRNEFYYEYCSKQSLEEKIFTEKDEASLVSELCFPDGDNVETGVLFCTPNKPGAERGVCLENKLLDRQGIKKEFFEELEDEFEDEEEHQFEKVSSVIFNAFIFMQV